MHTIHENLHNPLTCARDAADQARLGVLFPDLSTCPHPHFLALRPYANEYPELFYDRPIYSLVLDWLKERDSRQRDELRTYLASADAEISRAMLFLRQINKEDWHDISLTANDYYDQIRFIDRWFHPAYLRLVEGYLRHLYCRWLTLRDWTAGKGLTDLTSTTRLLN
jgi:hypothetical protein